jgi:hypothetical protein
MPMAMAPIIPLPAALADEPEFADELDEAIFAGSALPEVAARYVPTNRREAEWPMRKLAALTARAQEVHDQAADWRARIDEWEAGELQRVSGGVEYFTHLLERFAIDWRQANPKEATIRLPAGEISTTVPKTPSVSIDNEEATLAWAHDHLDGERYDAVVKSTEKVLVSGLKELASVQRRLVPFCEVCGSALWPRSLDQDDSPWDHAPSWTSEVEVAEHDHDAQPGSMWEVLVDGEPVPGVSAELGDIRATVKPAR